MKTSNAKKKGYIIFYRDVTTLREVPLILKTENFHTENIRSFSITQSNLPNFINHVILTIPVSIPDEEKKLS